MNGISNIASSIGVVGLSILFSITIVVVLFAVSRNIRRSFIGGIVSLGLYAVYKIANTAASSTVSNGRIPTWFSLPCALLISSVIVGIILDKIDYIDKIENYLDSFKSDENEQEEQKEVDKND